MDKSINLEGLSEEDLNHLAMLRKDFNNMIKDAEDMIDNSNKMDNLYEKYPPIFDNYILAKN
ncbi:MAG: hypothetical protein NTZ83_00535 [Candidatus Pacearchaeota archaeon]|nr:hypothetical protein [Candidatus Pacearchaeota archaeon]